MAYEAEFASALDKKVKDYIAEHAAQQGVDPGTKARMAQAGAADAAAVEAARVPPATGAPAQGAPKPGLGARLKSFGKAAITPGTYNPNMTTLAKGAYGLGKVSAAVAPVVGAISAASDSKEDVSKFADSLGFDYNSFGGRVGANALNFLRKTGDAATFGLAGRLGRVLTGGNFFEDDPPPTAPVPADMQPDGSRRGTLGEPAAPPAAASAPTTEGNVPGTWHPKGSWIDPEKDAEALKQRLMALGPKEQYGGYIEGPNGRVELPSGTVQRFGVRRRTVGDSFNESLAERRAMAKSELNIKAIEAGARMKTASRPDAASAELSLRKSAADEYLKKNPGDWGGYVEVLSGRDPKQVLGKIEDGRGTIIVQRDGKTISADEQRRVVQGQKVVPPSQEWIDAARKNRSNPQYRTEFIKRFGADAYEKVVGG